MVKSILYNQQYNGNYFSNYFIILITRQKETF